LIIFPAHLVEEDEEEPAMPPPIFLSYQWAHQSQVKLLKHYLRQAGYSCWMDVGQMGGGDKLFAKIDKGIRAAKVIVCCVTDKYAESPNCNREVSI
jgi:TIR domain